MRIPLINEQYLPGDLVSVIYEVDAENNVISVNHGWESFATDNSAGHLVVDDLIGKPLMEFVSGNITKVFWQTFIEKARAASTPLHLDYRCDSPNLRRYMRIKLDKSVANNLRFENMLLRSEPRQVHVYCERSQQRAAYTKVRCSFCCRILFRSKWIEVDDLVAESKQAKLQVVYGICGGCQNNLDQL